MGRRADELFPFQGRMVSAVYIADYYGCRNSAQVVRQRLRAGATPEEAARGLGKHLKQPDASGGIQPWEINRLRKRIRPGDKLRVTVIYADALSIADLTRKENCRVTGVYPHLVTLRRPCGLGVSRTYVELIQDGIR